MISAGDIAKRPPHMVLAGLSVTGGSVGLKRRRLPDGSERRGDGRRRPFGLWRCRRWSGSRRYTLLEAGSDNAPPTGCHRANAKTPASVVESADHVTLGQMAAFVPRKTPEPLPDITFQDASGKDVTLSSFKGKTVLLEPLGDLVRALPRGNAGPQPSAAGARQRQVRGRGAEPRPARATRPRASFSTRSRPTDVKLYADATAKQGIGAEARRHADDDPHQQGRP